MRGFSLETHHFAMGSLSAFPPHFLLAVFNDVAAEEIMQVCFCHQQKSHWLINLASDFEGYIVCGSSSQESTTLQVSSPATALVSRWRAGVTSWVRTTWPWCCLTLG